VASEAPARRPAVRHGPARSRSGEALRERFFALYLRSYALAGPGRRLGVYRSCARQLHALCGEDWARATIFRAEAALAGRFLEEAGVLPPGDPAARAAALRLSLMANPWAAIWTEPLQALGRDEFFSVCTLRGEERLREALAAGRGAVCAHYHTLFAPLFWTCLEHAGIAPGVLIREWVKTRRPQEAADPRARALEGARELKAAADALRAGGLVQVMADGYEGARKTELAFGNRRRGFETTFIDLALAARAPILPVSAALSADGGIAIEVGAPLRDDPVLERAARTRALLEAFAAFMAREWRAHPGDISWFQMARHLNLPAA
jgi:lauroyl/myristoyl acyltransferase